MRRPLSDALSVSESPNPGDALSSWACEAKYRGIMSLVVPIVQSIGMLTGWTDLGHQTTPRTDGYTFGIPWGERAQFETLSKYLDAILGWFISPISPTSISERGTFVRCTLVVDLGNFVGFFVNLSRCPGL